VTSPDDTDIVLQALRLGWYIAEVRGRNRPNAPPGANVVLPDSHGGQELPLRIERTPTERRIETQTVVTALARNLGVDDAPDGRSYGTMIDDQAKVLFRTRPPHVVAALNAARNQLTNAQARQLVAAGAVTAAAAGATGGPGDDARLQEVRDNLATAEQAAEEVLQQVAGQIQDAVAAQQQTAVDQQHAADSAQQASTGPVPEGQTAASLTQHAAAEQKAAQAAIAVVTTLQQAVTAIQGALVGQPATASRSGLDAVDAALKTISQSEVEAWLPLSEDLWRLDAYIQDQLTAKSDTQACGYQLGRGLSEAYWALDPQDVQPPANGKPPSWHSWAFLLGKDRCAELCRLTGRLGAYMETYTAAAVAGSIEVWKKTAEKESWRPDPGLAAQALYHQTRRWYELIILRQDPTTLIEPHQLIRNRGAWGRALLEFWPPLLLAAAGIAGLGWLVALLSNGSSNALAKGIAAVLAFAGIPIAGVTAKVKNGAQALLTRLRQDFYTELIAVAVTVPPPAFAKNTKELQAAINTRVLTTATPN